MFRTVQLGKAHRLTVRFLSAYSSRFYRYRMPAITRTPNHYQVLKVPVGASDQVIRSAFIELSKKYHPDVSKDTTDSEVFTQICEAYRTLHKHQSREVYDSHLRRQQGPGFQTETALTGKKVSTAWSQYQKAVRAKQLGRKIVSKATTTSKWLPMLINNGGEQLYMEKVVAMDEECQDMDEDGASEEETHWDTEQLPASIYVFITGFCAISGLVLMDVYNRFR
ncbi:hypothetical protein KR018_005925, partial [Drosophila ironensis]